MGLRKQPVWKVVVEGEVRAAGLTRDRARHLAMDLRKQGHPAQAVAAPPPVVRLSEQQFQEAARALLG